MCTTFKQTMDDDEHDSHDEEHHDCLSSSSERNEPTSSPISKQSRIPIYRSRPILGFKGRDVNGKARRFDIQNRILNSASSNDARQRDESQFFDSVRSRMGEFVGSIRRSGRASGHSRDSKGTGSMFDGSSPEAHDDGPNANSTGAEDCNDCNYDEPRQDDDINTNRRSYYSDSSSQKSYESRGRGRGHNASTSGRYDSLSPERHTESESWRYDRRRRSAYSANESVLSDTRRSTIETKTRFKSQRHDDKQGCKNEDELCCGKRRWFMVALAIAWFVLLMLGGVLALTGGNIRRIGSLFKPKPNKNEPISSQSPSPSQAPTYQPSDSPIIVRSVSMSNVPSNNPSILPSGTPSQHPSSWLTDGPSKAPSTSPSISPTERPSYWPSSMPSKAPSTSPSISPTERPSYWPSSIPSSVPSSSPTIGYRWDENRNRLVGGPTPYGGYGDSIALSKIIEGDLTPSSSQQIGRASCRERV